ncbi:MAG: hypothetical protein WDO24_22950 [Pseudomonadota bacterium]
MHQRIQHVELRLRRRPGVSPTTGIKATSTSMSSGLAAEPGGTALMSR